ncbi:MAG: radical SAM family heme chaperone HemW [Bacteroidales bacterium]|nr:radical SAM family heme chaperone HemW [Bacteroidales bacterium]
MMLYIHIPFCQQKCSYCAFYSVPQKALLESYLPALCKELSHRAVGEPLKSIYIGGGTPSLLMPTQMRTLVDTIRKHYNLSEVEEVTLECNPESFTAPFAQSLQSLHFFNRISLGVQSFSDWELRLLLRPHSSAQAADAIRNAKAAGFENVSVDLIYGLPSQTLSSWRFTLRRLEELMALGVIKHLSCYELTIEPDTIIQRQIASGALCADKGTALPDEGTIATFYDTLLEWCAAHGFEQYEVSNFCLPGFHSRHNSHYWDRTPYIGCGAAAHSFDGTHRRWNIANVSSYVSGAQKGDIPFEEETLTAKDAYNEYVMTALRTTVGIDRSRIDETYSTHLDKAIIPYVEHGLIEMTEERYRPTRQGLLQADGIAAALFADA